MTDERLSQLQTILGEEDGSLDTSTALRLMDELARETPQQLTDMLVDALNSDGEDRTSETAVRLLEGAASHGCVTPIYEVWLATRDPRLTALLTERGWVADFAAHLKVFRALEADRPEDLAHRGPEIVPPLLAAMRSSDERIRASSVDCLHRLNNLDTLDEVCARWLENRWPMLEKMIVARGYVALRMPSLVFTALLNNRLEVITRGGPEIVEPLTRACDDANQIIASRGRETLLLLKDPETIDAILEHWFHYRSQHVGSAIEAAGLRARTPLIVRVVAALKAGHTADIPTSGIDAIQAVVAALDDPDPVVSRGASEVLDRLLEDPSNRDDLCRLVVQGRSDRAEQIAVQRHFTPRDAEERALFFFLTEQWEDYEALDYDMSVLRKAFEHGGGDLRSRIAGRARRAGRLELVELVSGVRHRRRMGEMTAREWGMSLAILEDRQDWETLWRLAQTGPAVWAVEALRRLHAARWSPAAPSDLQGYRRLVDLALRCVDEAPVVGFLDRPFARFAAHERRVTGLIVNSYFDRTLATSSWDGSVKIRSMPEGGELHTLKGHRHPVNSLTATPDGSLLASGSGAERRVVLWKMPEGTAVRRLGGHERGVSSLAVSPDGRYLAAGGFDSACRLWRLGDGAPIATLDGHSSAVRSVAFAPAATLLATGDEHGRVSLWEIPSGRRLMTVDASGKMVKTLAFFPDGQTLASAGSDEGVNIWSLPNCERLQRLEGPSHVISAVAVSGDGRVLAAASWDGSVHLWIMPGGRQWGALREHTGPVTCLATDPESRVLVSGGNDRLVMMWNFQSGIFRRPTTRQDMERIEEPDDGTIPDRGREWLEFLLAQMKWRWRYDIELDVPSSRLQIGEFDIEVEG